MSKNLVNRRGIESIIESDEEFPSDCDEEREIPCYQDNDRFNNLDEAITFPWLSNMKIREFDKEDQKLNDIKNKILKGVLSSQDMLCAQCIINEGYCVDFCIWFLEYLKIKDMQPKVWNKSCLVIPIL